MSAVVVVAGFAVLVAAALALELRARRGGAGTPSLGDLADEVTRRPWGRAGALVGWLWLGWHLFVR